MDTQTIPESKYRSIFKTPKLWRTNKTTPMLPDSGEEKPVVVDTTSPSPSLVRMPTMKLPSPSLPSFKKSNDTLALKETGKNEVYELSTVNDSGVYLAPMPTQTKHDHWLGVDEDIFRFSLPSSDCLTTVSGRPHSFYTPSAIIASAV